MVAPPPRRVCDRPDYSMSCDSSVHTRGRDGWTHAVRLSPNRTPQNQREDLGSIETSEAFQLATVQQRYNCDSLRNWSIGLHNDHDGSCEHYSE